MKHIYLFIFIIILSGCSYKEIKEDYNYIPNNTIRFIRKDNDTSLLINKDDKLYLLLINKQNINIDIDYLINMQDIDNGQLIINDIIFKKNDKIEIIFNNYNFCIYIKEINKDNFKDCHFIYFYNPDKDFYITLNHNMLVLFYEEYTKFNFKFTYHLSVTWIDSYTISPSSYTDLTLNKDNFKVNAHQIRGETIHKKEDS